MSTFLALYRGNTIADSKLIAVSANPNIVAAFVDKLLAEPPDPLHTNDPASESLERGRRRALRLVRDEAVVDGE